MLQKPFLARCDNRKLLPRENPVAGAPEHWFTNPILSEFGKVGISFDFFVNWSLNPYQLTPNIWIKRILNVPPASLTDSDIQKILINSEGEDYLLLLATYAERQGLRLTYLLFRDIKWGKEAEDIIGVTVTRSNSGVSLAVQRITLDILQRTIRTHSGGEVRVGEKGLTYGTSELECYLSTTNSAYPGDVDLVVLDVETLDPEVILEYKKHNLSTSISEQKLGNYYPHPDRRKYDRLAILRDHLKPIPVLLNLYYPTNPETNACIEIVDGEPGKLVPSNRELIALPKKGDIDSYRAFVGKVLSLI